MYNETYTHSSWLQSNEVGSADGLKSSWMFYEKYKSIVHYSVKVLLPEYVHGFADTFGPSSCQAIEVGLTHTHTISTQGQGLPTEQG